MQNVHLGHGARKAQGYARHYAGPQNGWVEKAARAGYAAKGTVYLILGVLAVMAATNQGGDVTGSQGVLHKIAGQPFGQVLLVVVGIGLGGYALWRFVQAALDTERKGSDAKGIIKRIGYAMSGIVHVGLCVTAFQLVAGGSGGGGKQTWVAKALSESWGPAVIGILGVFVIGVGLYQFKKSIQKKFLDELKTNQMSQTETKAAKIVGVAGHAARGVVFPIIGYFLIKSAIEANPGAAKGVDGALQMIAQAGALPLAIVAAGLAAYGALQLFMAKYRRIEG